MCLPRRLPAKVGVAVACIVCLAIYFPLPATSKLDVGFVLGSTNDCIVTENNMCVEYIATESVVSTSSYCEFHLQIPGFVVATNFTLSSGNGCDRESLKVVNTTNTVAEYCSHQNPYGPDSLYVARHNTFIYNNTNTHSGDSHWRICYRPGFCLSSPQKCCSHGDCRSSYGFCRGNYISSSVAQTCGGCGECLFNTSRQSLDGRCPPWCLSPRSTMTLSNDRLTSINNFTFAGYNGLNTLKLDRNFLTAITSSPFQGLSLLRVLTLSQNQISVIHSDSFLGLQSLLEIYLSRNLIKEIMAGAFNPLRNLQKLNLAFNMLLTIPRQISLPALTFMSLHANSLNSVPSLVTPQLKTLDLSLNSITTITSLSFATFTSLTELRLDDNLISRIEFTSFMNFTSVNYLSLHNNSLTSLADVNFPPFNENGILTLYGNRITRNASVSLSETNISRSNLYYNPNPLYCSINVSTDEILCNSCQMGYIKDPDCTSTDVNCFLPEFGIKDEFPGLPSLPVRMHTRESLVRQLQLERNNEMFIGYAGYPSAIHYDIYWVDTDFEGNSSHTTGNSSEYSHSLQCGQSISGDTAENGEFDFHLQLTSNGTSYSSVEHTRCFTVAHPGKFQFNTCHSRDPTSMILYSRGNYNASFLNQVVHGLDPHDFYDNRTLDVRLPGCSNQCELGVGHQWVVDITETGEYCIIIQGLPTDSFGVTVSYNLELLCFEGGATASIDPGGIHLNHDTGTLSIAPYTSGNFSARIYATDEANHSLILKNWTFEVVEYRMFSVRRACVDPIDFYFSNIMIPSFYPNMPPWQISGLPHIGFCSRQNVFIGTTHEMTPELTNFVLLIPSLDEDDFQDTVCFDSQTASIVWTPKRVMNLECELLAEDGDGHRISLWNFSVNVTGSSQPTSSPSYMPSQVLSFTPSVPPTAHSPFVLQPICNGQIERMIALDNHQFHVGQIICAPGFLGRCAYPRFAFGGYWATVAPHAIYYSLLLDFEPSGGIEITEGDTVDALTSQTTGESYINLTTSGMLNGTLIAKNIHGESIRILSWSLEIVLQEFSLILNETDDKCTWANDVENMLPVNSRFDEGFVLSLPGINVSTCERSNIFSGITSKFSDIKATVEDLTFSFVAVNINDTEITPSNISRFEWNPGSSIGFQFQDIQDLWNPHTGAAHLVMGGSGNSESPLSIGDYFIYLQAKSSGLKKINVYRFLARIRQPDIYKKCLNGFANEDLNAPLRYGEHEMYRGLQNDDFVCACAPGYKPSGRHACEGVKITVNTTFLASVSVLGALLLITISLVVIRRIRKQRARHLRVQRIAMLLSSKSWGSSDQACLNQALFDAFEANLDNRVKELIGRGASAAARHPVTHQLAHGIALSRPSPDLDLLTSLFSAHCEIDAQVGFAVRDPLKLTLVGDVFDIMTQKKWKNKSCKDTLLHIIVKASHNCTLLEKQAIVLVKRILDRDPSIISSKNIFLETAGDLSMACKNTGQLQRLLTVIVFDRYQIRTPDRPIKQSSTSLLITAVLLDPQKDDTFDETDLFDTSIDDTLFGSETENVIDHNIEPKREYVIKLMTDRDPWCREIESRNMCDNLCNMVTVEEGLYIGLTPIIVKNKSVVDRCRDPHKIPLRSCHCVIQNAQFSKGIFAKKEIEKYRFALVMEKGERTLQEIIVNERLAEQSLDMQRLTAIHLAKSVESIHHLGVIHGNIKPHSIIRMSDHTFKLTDFSMAYAPVGGPKRITCSIPQRHAGPSIVIADGAYQTPEMNLWANESLDSRVPYKSSNFNFESAVQRDIWSFGVTFFEMISGTQLFQHSYGELTEEAAMRLRNWKGLRKSELSRIEVDHPLSPALIDLINWMLEPDLQQRPRSMADVLKHSFFDPAYGALRMKFVIYRIHQLQSNRLGEYRRCGHIVLLLNEEDSTISARIALALAPHCERLWCACLGTEDDAGHGSKRRASRLLEELEQCDHVIALVSDAYLASKTCGLELSTAVKLNKKISPVRIGPMTSILWPPSKIGNFVLEEFAFYSLLQCDFSLNVEVNVKQRLIPLVGKSDLPHSFDNDVSHLKNDAVVSKLLTNHNTPRELIRSNVTIVSQLGNGEFGAVYKALYSASATEPAYLVAVKQLKGQKSAVPSKTSCSLFLTEALLTSQLRHKNVLGLLGIVTAGHPYLMILQFCERGALDVLLRSSSHKTHNLVLYCLDIAEGMEYLAALQIVHRDLAARNILIDSKNTAKIADFGLSKSISGRQYYKQVGSTSKLPLRWLAPELFSTLKFSTSSDVWAFGVTLNEVFSGGGIPYCEWPNSMVVDRVSEGFSLSCPKQCPESLYIHVIKPCFAFEPKKRPSFQSLVETITLMIELVEDGEVTSVSRPIGIEGCISYDFVGIVDSTCPSSKKLSATGLSETNIDSFVNVGPLVSAQKSGYGLHPGLDEVLRHTENNAYPLNFHNSDVKFGSDNNFIFGQSDNDDSLVDFDHSKNNSESTFGDGTVYHDLSIFPTNDSDLELSDIEI